MLMYCSGFGIEAELLQVRVQGLGFRVRNFFR